MISFLKGKLIFTGKNEIVLDVNGVGYQIFISKKISDVLPAINEDFSLYTYLDVKENSLALFGFFDQKEREVFKLLISVNGISGRTAHNILSHAGFEDIIKLFSNSNALSGMKIPGIGIKKIEMISLALKDKLFKISGSYDVFDSGIRSSKEQSRLEALNALMNLGYARSEAEKIIREVLKLNPDMDFNTEELIKKSLEYIS